jgi:tight adherence protein B
MSSSMIAVSFLAGFFLIFAVNYALADIAEAHRQRIRRRLEQEIRLRQKEAARATLALSDLSESAAESRLALRTKTAILDKLRSLLLESGIAMRPDQLLVACLGAGVVAFLPGWLIWQNIPLSSVLGVSVAPLPVLIVLVVRTKRRDKLLSQLPTAFDLMARTLRAGQTLGQSFQTVADEAPTPISEEFGFCYEQQNLGLAPEASLRDLARRTGLLELKIFVMAVMIHRQTGGNMSELLDKLGAVIRDRARIRGSIKALTAEGMMQAYILCALPPAMLAMLCGVAPDYVTDLFDNYWLLAASAGAMALGMLWMRRIVNFDF